MSISSVNPVDNIRIISLTEISVIMFEAHFCCLESQSNIYGICKIEVPGRPHEILMTSLRGKLGPKVTSLRIIKGTPKAREIHFSYLPGMTRLISLLLSCHLQFL